MERYSIRDNRVAGPVKTRVIDFIINDDGSFELEVKDGKMRKRILYEDFKKQVAIAIHDMELATEP